MAAMNTGGIVHRILDSFIWEDRDEFWKAFADAVFETNEIECQQKCIAVFTKFRETAKRYGYNLEAMK